MVDSIMKKLMNEMILYYSGDAKRIQHFIKVHSLAKFIGEMEGLESKEQFILESAAVVHDIGIKKAEAEFGSSNGKQQEELGPDIAREMLNQLRYNKEDIERICYLVGHHHTYTNIDGIDYQILVEADFLVNMYEDELSEASIKSVYQNIFRTETGKRLCKVMYKL